MFILSKDLNDEFLAAPTAVRCVIPGNDQSDPSFLVKAETLLLKFLVNGCKFKIRIEKNNTSGEILYGIHIADDPSSPAFIWSLVENHNELLALQKLFQSRRCNIFLFNEAAFNLARAKIELDMDELTGPDFKECHFIKSNTEEAAKLVTELNIFDFTSNQFKSILNPKSIIEWTHIKTLLPRLGGNNAVLSLDILDEGGQQEILAHCLADDLLLKGIERNPNVFDGSGYRELTDLFFSHEYGSFLVESKTLAVFGKNELPNRSKLRDRTLKNIEKALRQLRGASKNLKLGKKVESLNGEEIIYNKDKPQHCIVLVPDLSLLHEATQLGGKFVASFYEENNAFLHILDINALLRSIQHAEIYSKKSESGLPLIVTFDYALLKRWEHAISAPTPNIDVKMI